MLCVPLAVAIVLATCSPVGRAIVTEVYYDAAGDDTGHEFVELFNPWPHPVALAGVRLESGDGAGAGRWTLRWTGGAADSIAPGARFVVGGALVAPAPQAVVPLALQNGPDAIRLVWPDGATEVVGYGALSLAEYFCGAPAADVESGFSLARVPDASDLGSNAADFRAAPPSPGRANQSRRNLAVVPGALALLPPWPAPLEAVTATGRLANAGADTLALGDVTLATELVEVPADGAVLRMTPRPAFLSRAERSASPGLPIVGPFVILPGETLLFESPLAPLAAGRYRVRVSATAAGDENEGDDRDSLLFRVGPGPLAVTEIQFHPADGEGEWVEVRNRSSAPLDLAAFTLADRGTARGVPEGGSGPLEPESLAVLAQDRAALLAAWPGIAAARVWEVRPWSALNNTDGDDGFADRVALREADGLAVAIVDYRAAGVPAGVPIEWREGDWRPALDARGTPLAPPRAPPPAARRFDLFPARLAGGGPLRLEWALPWPRATVRADLYDLEGRRIAEILPERSVPGRASRELTLAGTPAGVYWVVLEARAPSGGERLAESRALRITGAAR